ncbi:hypothetical protein [Phenylobacterium sp.]|uniref:hypothetical protein n=1 Tax=Phenylobacterium sp. TaxID=1871053 RepID=UPI002723CE65|nr:hypothetical protein [Phenylobacterium sp.]MDO8377612.1 hypothetical protein [Phenylobacterium sp.]
MAIQDRPITTPIQRTSLNLAAKRVAAKLSVFVAGPFIDKTWTDAELSEQSAATRLRLAIKTIVEEKFQHQAVFGEHRGVNEMAEEHFGSQTSAAIAEIAMLGDCDAVIIIPASVGSFCELGAWSTREDFCRKLLVIANEKYRKDQSYINLGTFRMAVNNGASIAWCDLENEGEVIGHVEAFVRRAHDKVMMRLVNNGR